MPPHFKDTSEDCAICLSPLTDGDCLTLTCGHIYHEVCLKTQLHHSCPDPSRRLLFSGCHCAKCKHFCDHPALADHAAHPRELLAKVDGLIRDIAPGADILEGRRQFAFYLCSVCSEPFFGGGVDCIDEEHDEITPEERVCDTCALSTTRADCTDPEHSPFHVWKCRMCCNPSTRVCFGRTHFCDDCHARYSDNDHTPILCPGRPTCKSPMLGVEVHTNGVNPSAEQLLYCAACVSGPSQDLPEASRNLLVNPSGALGDVGWMHDSTLRWKVESSDIPFAPYSTNFVSTYHNCVMSQAVDMSRFIRSGHEDITVSVSARYRARTDCPSIFILEAAVLDSDFREVCYIKTDELAAPADCWEVARHTFNLGQGRYVVIRLTGRDSLFWEGAFGSKVTDCNISVVLGDAEEGQPLSDEELGVDQNCLRAAVEFRNTRLRELDIERRRQREEERRLQREIVRGIPEEPPSAWSLFERFLGGDGWGS